MKRLFLFFLLVNTLEPVPAQKGFNYYKDSSRVGSANAKAYAYFKKAYYDCIWNWTTAGADSAEYYLKLAVQEDTGYSAAYAFLAHVYQFKTYNAQNFDKYFALQKKYAEKAVSYHPKTGDAYSVMADVAWTEHDTTETINLLRRGIANEPDNIGNYFWLALRYRQMKREKYYDSAIYYFRYIMQLDPEYGQAYMKTGNVYHLDKHLYDSAKYYYLKAIDIYHTVKPRDNRMMDAYYWLGEVYKLENKFDSAVYYYQLLLHEMEPSDMYIKDMRLSSTYRSLFEVHQGQSRDRLYQFIQLNKNRMAKDTGNTDLLFEVLEQNYMPTEQDSVYEKYALPLARRLQTIHLNDPYGRIFAIDDEFLILKKLNRKAEALKVLESCIAVNPNEPIILFELGRMKILDNNRQQGLAYLKKSKLNLDKVFTKQVFTEQLNDKDFDQVRSTSEFKRLAD